QRRCDRRQILLSVTPTGLDVVHEDRAVDDLWRDRLQHVHQHDGHVERPGDLHQESQDRLPGRRGVERDQHALVPIAVLAIHGRPPWRTGSPAPGLPRRATSMPHGDPSEFWELPDGVGQTGWGDLASVGRRGPSHQRELWPGVSIAPGILDVYRGYLEH